MKFSFGFLVAFLFFNSLCFAQLEHQSNGTNPSFIGLSLDYGYILQHTSSLRKIGDTYPYGVSIEWGKTLLNQNAWEFCNCFPKLGVEASYLNFGENDVLGQSLIVLGFAEPYFNVQKEVHIFFKLGLGGTYLNQPFDLISNPINETYSTHLSFVIMMGAGINYRIDTLWNLRLMAKYNHTSNGGIRTPNKGINFPTLSLGIIKNLNALMYPDFQKVENRQAPQQKERLSLVYFSGWTNANVGTKDKFYVFGFIGQYSRWIGRRSALSIGSELILDYSRRELIANEGKKNHFIQAGALLGHEFWLGKVTFSQHLGVYFVNDYRINDNLYQRYTLTYQFSKHLSAGIGIKAHRHVADFFDIRLGYRF